MSEEARLDQVLTPAELEQLTAALKMLCASGWGDLVIRVKGGRIDVLQITQSVLVRGKKSD